MTMEPKFPEFDDKAFMEEVRLQEMSDKVLRLRMHVLHKQMTDAVLNAGVPDMRMVFCDDVTTVLAELLRAVKKPDTERTDLVYAVQVAVLVAWRLTNAAVIAAARLLDPASKEDPDAPLDI